MGRKPMLLKKVTRTNMYWGREVVGLIGTHHGVGVTHTGLMLSFYMGEELDRKTAFLECNRHNDMSFIQNAYRWTGEDSESFSYRNITCYPQVSKEQIPKIFSEDYECVIMDFGIDFAANQEELLRCTTKIVIGGRSEWDIQKLSIFLDKISVVHGSETWKYFIPQANYRTITKLCNEMGRKVMAIPANDEPVRPSQETNRFFGRIF